MLDTKDTEQILGEFTDTLRGLDREERTIQEYRRIARVFLTQAEEEEPTDKEALQFLGKMKEGYKTNTRQVAYYALKALYSMMEWPWGIRSPKVKSYEELNQPILKPGQIAKMIEKVKEWEDRRLPAYLAVSTIYGLRLMEMAGITQEHLQDQTLLVLTRKGGVPHRHQIAEEIAPYLEGVPWGLGRAGVNKIFKEICYLAFNDVMPGYGWHSIRRSLVTEMTRKGLDIMMLYKFMRWKPQGMMAIPMTYARLEDPEVDEAVFKKHPFLEMWD